MGSIACATRSVAEFLLGQNFQVACIPVDIVFAVVEFILAEAKWGISIAQSNLGMIRLCDALVDTEELTANYTRVGHIHDDLDDFKTEENAKLDILEAKWDLALRVLLERDLQWNSGDRMNVNYLDRLTDSCDAAEQAITDTETLGYALHVNAKPSLLKGQCAALRPIRRRPWTSVGWPTVSRRSAHRRFLELSTESNREDTTERDAER